MLKVVIADDEVRICRLVQMLGDWELLGMEVVGTAANGLEALELVKTLLPDILITDIRMPGCDGLELIKKAKELVPYLEIVIISGYAQFEYAQTAISQGVGGYLLKPIKKEALMSTLEKLAERCRKRKNSNETMEHLLNINQHMQCRHLMEDLLSEKLTSITKNQLKEEYDFPYEQGYLQVFIIKLDCNPEKMDNISFNMSQQKAEEIFESTILPLCIQGFVYFQHSAGYGIINYAKNKKDTIRHVLRSYLNQMQVHRSFLGQMEISLAISNPIDVVENLQISIHEAQIALSQRFFEGSQRLLESIPPASYIRTQQMLEQYNRTISHAVDSLSINEADKAVDELYFKLKQVEGVRGCEVLELVLSAGRMFALLIHLGGEQLPISRFEETCEVCGNVDQLFQCLRQFQKRNIELMLKQRENESVRPIRLAKQYIQQHFHEAITLEDVCAATGFSVSYFSTMFKKETGEGFSKYLTRIRIEQAKYLLQDTEMSVAEIGEKVGYNDIKHFTTTFKKLTSLNPGQYRKLYG